MKLRPEHFIDIVGNPSLFDKVLSNKDVAQLWSASMDEIKKISPQDLQLLKKLSSNPKLSVKMDPMLVARGIATYVEYMFILWKVESVQSANALAATAPWFVELSKTTPEINPDTKYETAFRGTNIDEDELDDFLSKTKISDWKKVSQKQAKLMLWTGNTIRYRMYVGPKSRQFTYKPYREIQSWTVKPNVAAAFGNHLIATPLDKTFFFDPSYMAQHGPNSKEMEVVHFGKEPMKVLLLVRDEFFPVDKMPDDDNRIKRVPFSLSEDTQIRDEEGTLTIPL